MTLMLGTTNPIPKLDKVPPGTRIAFYGPMCSGKTFAADYLKTFKGFYTFSFASKIKAIAYELYGAAGKDGTNRTLYQHLGDALRQFDNDVFIKYTLNAIFAYYPKQRVVIDDLRLPHEAHILRANGFKLVEVKCDEDERIKRVKRLYPNVPETAGSHASEVSTKQIRGDSVIYSSDPAQTYHMLDELLVEYWTSK